MIGRLAGLLSCLAAAAAQTATRPSLPSEPGAAVEAARAMLRDDRYEDALGLAASAADRWPDHSPAHVVKADALYRRGDFDDAERHYRRAVAIDPNDASAHFGVGRILRTQGRYGEAAESFSRAAALAPDVPRHLRVLANHLARREDSVGMLKRYLELTRSLPDRGGEEESAARNVEAWLSLLERMGDRPISHLARRDPCEVRIQVTGGQAYVRLGAGGARSQRFVFDTGATGVTISPRLASKLKLAPIRPFTIHGTGERRTETGDLVVVDRLVVCEGIELQNVPATVRDPSGPEEGLVGPALFSAFDVRIDLRGGRLSFRQPRSEGPGAGGRAEPFRNVGGQIVIDSSLNGVRLNAMVDTGAASTLISRSAVARVPGMEALPGEWFRGGNTGVGGALGSRKVIASGTLSFAGRDYKADGLMSGDLSGFSRALESEVYVILGSPHLDDSPFTIDYRNMAVVFESGRE